MKKIYISGAMGYKGSVLVPKLLTLGYEVVAIDANWFGNFLPKSQNLEIIEEDVRNVDKLPRFNGDTFIHLASVANDPTSDLNPKLTWEISALATYRLIEKCIHDGVENFIYASSGSVYGIQEKEDIVEDTKLIPISEYNKTKMIAERVLISFKEKINYSIIRPATVCGISPRMRFDVAVNLLTINALTTNEITVLGGDQLRPNVHIDDITNLYCSIVKEPKKYNGIFNCGFENLSIIEIAEIISHKTNAKIIIKSSNDPRTYRMNSDKLLGLGFKPQKKVENAIDEIIAEFNNGNITNEDHFNNLKWMKKRLDKIIL